MGCTEMVLQRRGSSSSGRDDNEGKRGALSLCIIVTNYDDAAVIFMYLWSISWFSWFRSSSSLHSAGHFFIFTGYNDAAVIFLSLWSISWFRSSSSLHTAKQFFKRKKSRQPRTPARVQFKSAANADEEATAIVHRCCAPAWCIDPADSEPKPTLAGYRDGLEEAGKLVQQPGVLRDAHLLQGCPPWGGQRVGGGDRPGVLQGGAGGGGTHPQTPAACVGLPGGKPGS